MEMKPVTSSQIESIGHDPATNTMAIKFKGGGLYHYANVKPEQHQQLLGAESIGSHFGKNFKKNSSHPYTKIS